MNNIYSESENLNPYWEDGSYIELSGQPSSMSNVKVFYGSNNGPPYYKDDHSAVTTSNSNVFISKMGCGTLCSHLKTNSPYDASDLKYFTTFQVNGPQLVCSGDTATFITPDYENCTFNWTYNTSLLDYVSGQGTKTFVVEPKNSYSQGNAWVKLELIIDLDDDVTRTVTKNVWVGVPINIDLDMEGYSPPGPGSSTDQLCGISTIIPSLPSVPEMNITDYSWNAGAWQPYVLSSSDQLVLNVPPSAPSPQSIMVAAVNQCGPSTYISKQFWVDCGYYMMISPNPTTGETTLTIESTSEEKTVDETVEWELEIYNPAQALKEKRTKLKGNSTTIQTQSWKEGVYVVRVKYKDKILTGKLVVKK